MKRRLEWICFTLAIVVLILGVLYFPREVPKEKRLKVENFLKVKIGMTIYEVERLLGGPDGNYGPNPTGGGIMTMEMRTPPPGSVEKKWFNENNMFEISFDPKGRVDSIHKRGSYQQTSPPGILGQ